MRVLVLGGAGYIGSVIVEELIRAGHEATVYDSLIRGHRDAVHPQATFIPGDIHDRSLLLQAMRDSQSGAVIHMAGLIEVGESVAHPEHFFHNNVAGSIEVLRAMVEVGMKKIVCSSTGSLYGNTDKIPVGETNPTHPTNPYVWYDVVCPPMPHEVQFWRQDDLYALPSVSRSVVTS